MTINKDKVNYYLGKLSFYMKHPRKMYLRALQQYPQLIRSDKFFVNVEWRLLMDYPLDLENPQSFNQKLQWLKLYDHNPDYVKMVDKVEAKKYVASLIGEEHIIPTLGVWDKFEDIDFSKLPQHFVLKVAHDSGGVFICKDKDHIDKEKVRKFLSYRQSFNYYVLKREWPYKEASRRILCEKFMDDGSGRDLRDYKLFCFDGKVRFFKIDLDRFHSHHAVFFDRDCKGLPFGEAQYPPSHASKENIIIPEAIKEMIAYADIISKDIPFVRVDFYEINGQTFFGEITFYPASGFMKLTDREWDFKIGEYFTLPKSKRI